LRKTRPTSKLVQRVLPATQLAAGLHHSRKRRTYLFRDFKIDSIPKRLISIGRGKNCDIRINSDFVSEVHAVLERQEDGMLLVDHHSTNGVYVNGERVAGPVALTVGMDIQIGHELLIATDASGVFPIPAYTISDMCRKAATLYGSDTGAGEHLGRSRMFVARQKLPRALRRKGAKK
jgi:hypothetical protein